MSTRSTHRDSTIAVVANGNNMPGSIHNRISHFNSLTAQSIMIDHNAVDLAQAAVKRAVMGREQAEVDMRRYQDETRDVRRDVRALRETNMSQADEIRHLKRIIEEGVAREHKVAERLEDVMEKYGRSKESHTHAQTAWEKEIRRTRKETLKSQSHILELQSELKSARAARNTAETARDQARDSLQAQQNHIAEQNNTASTATVDATTMTDGVNYVDSSTNTSHVPTFTISKVQNISAEIVTNVVNTDPATVAGDATKGMTNTLADLQAFIMSEDEIRGFFGKTDGNEEGLAKEQLEEHLVWEQDYSKSLEDEIEFLETECRLGTCQNQWRLAHLQAALSVEQQTALEMAINDPDDPAIASETRHTVVMVNHEIAAYKDYECARDEARTPSVEPPALARRHISLASLVEGPCVDVGMNDWNTVQRSDEAGPSRGRVSAADSGMGSSEGSGHQVPSAFTVEAVDRNKCIAQIQERRARSAAEKTPKH